jgi:tetratricopeptide (TPR) repeat protein
VVWTESTQSLVGDLFELQDLISQKIIKSLELKLSDEERLGLQRKNTKSPEAYELFLKANELSLQVDQWEKAKDMYILCLEKDPTFSTAMARLARCYRLLGKYSFRNEDSIRYLGMSEAYLSHSLRLDPQADLAIGLYAQLMVDYGKPNEALKTLVKRINVSSSNAHLFASLVHVLRFCGLLNESLEADIIAKSIDSTVLTSVGHTHWMLGNYERAKEFTKGDIGYIEAVSLSSMNRYDEAIDKLKINELRVDNERLKAYLGSLKFALLKNREESLRNLKIAFMLSIDGEAIYYLTRTYAYWGEQQMAMDGLIKAVDKGFYQYLVFETDPWLDSLRTLPEYTDLIDRAKRLSMESIIALQSIPMQDVNLLKIFKLKQGKVLA